MHNDFTVLGFKQKRSKNRLPDAPISREHPKDSSFRHIGTAVRDELGRIVDIVDEECRKRRHSNMSGRSKNAAAHSGRPHAFVHTKGPVDTKLDTPYAPIGDTGHAFGKNGARGKLGKRVRAMRAAV